MVNHHRVGQRALLAALLLLAYAACTAKDPSPAADDLSALPEVREITFTGNMHFSNRTLLKQMAT
jgi:hypothetical protein